MTLGYPCSDGERKGKVIDDEETCSKRDVNIDAFYTCQFSPSTLSLSPPQLNDLRVSPVLHLDVQSEHRACRVLQSRPLMQGSSGFDAGMPANEELGH